MLSKSNFLTWSLVSVGLLVILIYLAVWPIYEKGKYAKQIELSPHESAYIALNGDLTFILVSDTIDMVDNFDQELNKANGVLTRTGKWQDNNDVSWSVYFSTLSSNSITINDDVFLLQDGEFFLLDSSTQRAIQVEIPDKMVVDDNFDADQIRNLISLAEEKLEIQ